MWCNYDTILSFLAIGEPQNLLEKLFAGGEEGQRLVE
jgi:hypothetical protein